MGNRNKFKPPRLFEAILDWYCSDIFLEDLKGDLYEYFDRRVEMSGLKYARLMFVIDVIRNCKLFLFRPLLFNGNSNYQAMLLNNLKSIRRNILKNKFYASINIVGLALGIAGAFFIWEYVKHETSYEDFHHNRENIYRITSEYIGLGSFEVHWARTPQDWADDLIAELPEVQAQIRFQNYYPRIVKVGEKSFKEEHGFAVDSNVFEVFTFPLIAGDAKSALQEPFSVVLTEKLSKKYFGNKSPIGETIQILNEADSSLENYKVTGVMSNLPSNTHLPVNFLTSFRNAEERKGWAYNYVRLADETDVELTTAKLPPMIEKYRGNERDPGTVNFYLQQLDDIHLNSHKAREILPPGDMFYVRIFSIAGIFVLLMAIINFTNLSLSKSLDRTREVGIRKALGSQQGSLFQYFMSESMTYSFLAATLAGVLIIVLTPSFRVISGVSILLNQQLLISLSVMAIATGFFSGLYPALMLARFKTVSALKGKTSLKGSISLRQLLVGVQFIISLIIVSSTLITTKQFDFLQKSNLGIETEQIIAITNNPTDVQDDYKTFKNELKKIPGVKDVTAAMEVPSRAIRDAGNVSLEGIKTDVVIDIQPIDTNFLEVMEIDFVAGQGFSESIRNQTAPEYVSVELTEEYLKNVKREYIINETAVKQLGLNSPEEAIGLEFGYLGYLSLQTGRIVGVAKDYHQETLHTNVDPVVMVHEPIWLRTFFVKLETEKLGQSLEAVDGVWKEMFPNFPMESAFLNDMFEKLYQSEQRQKEILSLFSSVIVLIALLGLLGLLSFTLQRRMKELAIRKILGATKTSIIYLFGKTLVVQAFIALCVAAPVTLYVMQGWLDNFAYRTSISGLEFFLSFLTLLLVLGTTVIIQVGKSANLNPVEILRYE